MKHLTPNWGPPLPPYVPDTCDLCKADKNKSPFHHICPVLWPRGILKNPELWRLVPADTSMT